MRPVSRERAVRDRPDSVESLGSPDISSSEAQPRSSTDRFAWWLVLVCAAALILRLVIVYLGRHDALSGDGFEYSVQANLNARGEWFISVYGSATRTPDALHPPAWTLVLTVWAWLGQHSFFAQQILAACIGSLTVGAVGLAGRRIGGARVGLIAAGIAALYPGLWVYERAVLSETLLLLGIAIVILLGYRFRARPSARSAAVLGIVCGLLALTRSEQILVFVALVAPLILALQHLEWRRRIAWLTLAALGVLVVVTPWTIYNLGRFDHPVLLSNNFGSAVAQGNCAITYYGPLTGSYSLGCLTSHPHGDQTDQNTALLHHGLAYLDHHVTRLPVVVLAREGRAFGFWDPFQQVHLDAQWEGNGTYGASYVPTAIWVNRLGLFGFWLLLVPAGAGVFALRRRRIPVYPLLGFFAIVVFTAATTYGEPRYRAAVEVPLVVLAAVGISAALSHRRPAASHGDQTAARPESSFASTTIAREHLDHDQPQQVTDRVPVRTLAVVAVVISLLAVAVNLNLANGVTPAQSKMLRPSNEAVVRGRILLDASAPLGVTKVEFHATGHGLRNTVVATGRSSAYGWVAYWDANTVLPGRYHIWSVAYIGGSPNISHAIDITISS